MAIIAVLRNSYEVAKALQQYRARGGAVWQLVGLITRRSQVQILPPQPTPLYARQGMPVAL